MKTVLLFLSLLVASKSHAFLLVHPDYRLSNYKDVTVNIGAGGCQADGVSNADLMSMINTSIDDYWNTVAESSLHLKGGGEVTRTTDPGRGEIIVYCTALGATLAGVAYPQIASGGCYLQLNSTLVTPGAYTRGDIISVLTHELGHCVGLHHSGDPASVMTYEVHDWGPAPTYLSQDDRDGVSYLYPREGKYNNLIPGCSAIAATSGASPGFSFWAYVSELIFIFGAIQLTRMRKFITQKQ